jgi:hypothetical protein
MLRSSDSDYPVIFLRTPATGGWRDESLTGHQPSERNDGEGLKPATAGIVVQDDKYIMYSQAAYLRSSIRSSEPPAESHDDISSRAVRSEKDGGGIQGGH